MKDKKIWKQVAFVLSSKNRKAVFEKLHELEITTPKRLAEKCGVPQQHTSKSLKQLSDEGLVECLNPEVRKGKLYCLTDLGEKTHSRLGDIEL